MAMMDRDGAVGRGDQGTDKELKWQNHSVGIEDRSGAAVTSDGSGAGEPEDCGDDVETEGMR
ncbi:hypothetical protein M9458_032683, partial [Cirrhinus mrigala]